MKKGISIIITLILMICSVSTYTLAAVSSGENFNVAFAESGSITIDGVISSGEWDGAAQFTVNKDTTGFADPTDLSVAYKLKWDATYLYICEERTDTDPLKYIVTEELFMSGQFYQGDATLFFMWFDNGVAPADPNLDYIDIQYTASSPAEGTIYGMRLHEGGDRSLFADDDLIASTVGTYTSVIELKFKLSDLPNAAGNITAGSKIQFYVCDTKTKNDVTNIVLWDDWDAQAYQLIWGLGLGIDVTDWNTMTLTAEVEPTPSPTIAPTAAATPTTMATLTAAATLTPEANPTTGGSSSDFGIILLLIASAMGMIIIISKKSIRN